MSHRLFDLFGIIGDSALLNGLLTVIGALAWKISGAARVACLFASSYLHQVVGWYFLVGPKACAFPWGAIGQTIKKKRSLVKSSSDPPIGHYCFC